MPVELAEAWLFAAMVVAGLSVGALGLLFLGRLLGRDWVTPLDDELQPAAQTLPVAALLWLPIAFALPALFPWARPEGAEHVSAAISAWFSPAPFLLRLGAYMLLWSLLAWLVASRSHRAGWSAAGLALLLPTAALAGIDWVLGRPPFWWSSLFGFAFAFAQLAPALALAFLANALQGEDFRRIHDRSLTSALTALAAATLWLWFVQYLAAWMGNLPDAAAWYEARLDGGRWIALALAAAMLMAAMLLLLQRHRGDFTIIAAAALILAQHVLHSRWLLRPAGTRGTILFDAAALLILGGIWAAFWLWLMRRHEARSGQSGRFGSSKRGRSGGTSGGQRIVSPD